MLHGEKVYLRRLEPADLERTFRWINDPEIMVIMGVRGPRTVKEQEVWYENIALSRTNLIFAICQTSNGSHIGNASLFDIDFINRNAGLTIFLGDAQDRHKGYGTEVVRLLADYGFEYLNLHKIFCKTDNPDAAKMYELIGFKKEGILREQAFQFGKYVDKIVYGLLRSEYVIGQERM